MSYEYLSIHMRHIPCYACEPRQNTALRTPQNPCLTKGKPPSNTTSSLLSTSHVNIFHDGNSKNPFSPIRLVYMGLRAYKPLSSYIYPLQNDADSLSWCHF